jgi:hypothetical protein
MPPFAPIWSKFFVDTSEFAKKSGGDSFVCFVRELECLQRHWDLQPRPCPGVNAVKGTRQNPVPATRQQEMDELLCLAVQTCPEKSMLLLAAGASPNARGNHSRKYAVLWVTEKRRKNDLLQGKFTTLLQEFIDKGLDISVTGEMLRCVANHTLAMVKILVEAGTVVDGGRDRRGLNALGTAVAAGREDIVEYLVTVGKAAINLRDPYRMRGAVHHTRCTHTDCDPVARLAYPYTLPLDPPPVAVFMSCNQSMLTKLASLGADLTIPCANQSACARGVQEHKHKLVNERRLAFAMGLQHRLGAVSQVHGIDKELVRMVLDTHDCSNVVF